MRLNVPKAVGTHTFSTTDASASYAVMNANYFAGYDPTTGTVTGAGTIVVSELTATSVTGTFTFTGIDQQTGGAKSVLSGKFFVGL